MFIKQAEFRDVQSFFKLERAWYERQCPVTYLCVMHKEWCPYALALLRWTRARRAWVLAVVGARGVFL